MGKPYKGRCGFCDAMGRTNADCEDCPASKICRHMILDFKLGDKGFILEVLEWLYEFGKLARWK